LAAYRATRQLRSTDFDVYGHLNQAAYHEVLEDARLGFLLSMEGASVAIVVARVELDYRREVPFGTPEVIAEIWVSRVGRSSFQLSQVIRLPGAEPSAAEPSGDESGGGELVAGEVAAEGTVTLVAWDGERRGSRPLGDEERAALERHLVTPADQPAGPPAEQAAVSSAGAGSLAGD